MRLIKVNSKGKIEFDDKLLGVDAFFQIWDRDESENKEMAIKEISFVYFITSMNPDNSFREYHKNERVKVVADLVFGYSVDYRDDKVINNAVNSMITLDKSHTKEFLRDIINNIGKLRNFLTAVDLDERDLNGKLIHNPKQYSDILSKQTELLKSLKGAIDMVDEESNLSENKLRGDVRKELEFS